MHKKFLYILIFNMFIYSCFISNKFCDIGVVGKMKRFGQFLPVPLHFSSCTPTKLRKDKTVPIWTVYLFFFVFWIMKSGKFLDWRFRSIFGLAHPVISWIDVSGSTWMIVLIQNKKMQNIHNWKNHSRSANP